MPTCRERKGSIRRGGGVRGWVGSLGKEKERNFLARGGLGTKGIGVGTGLTCVWKFPGKEDLPGP